MPSLIGSGGLIAGGTGSTTFARNFEKADVSTIMGTRKLKFYKVVVNSSGVIDMSKGDLAGTEGTSYTDPSSLYAKSIIALQGFFEIYAVLTPGTGGFIFVVAEDTANGAEPSSNIQATTFGAAEAAVKAATAAVTSVAITEVTVAGTGVSIS
jgi:hypothetical protein